MTKPDLMAELAEGIRREADISARPGQLDRLNAIADKLEAHHAELEAVVRDAARYRWLRDNHVDRWEDKATGAQRGFSFSFEGPTHNVDADIDQAMHNSAREG